MEAHKVILASSSPFFENILQKNKHPHPLIYFTNFKSYDMAALLEFVYLGEAKVDQDHLGSFLALAEHIKLKGLTGETFSIETEKDEKPLNLKPDETKKSLLWETTSNVTESVGQNIEKLSIPGMYRQHRYTNTRVASEFDDGENTKDDSEWEAAKRNNQTSHSFYLQSMWKRGQLSEYEKTY